MTTNRSPNFNARDPAVPLRYVVVHYTGMPTFDEALARLCDPKAEVSAHYLINEDGCVTALVEESHRAWHAGKSFWRGCADMNSASIGIELVNPGHEFGYRPFPTAQIEALKILLHDIKQRHALPQDFLVGHSDIAPSRKTDPGELFPWQELATEGLGLWPSPAPEDYAPPHGGEISSRLRAIGYDCPTEDTKVLTAFQRHYHPESLSHGADAETLARVRSLAKKVEASTMVSHAP